MPRLSTIARAWIVLGSAILIINGCTTSGAGISRLSPTRLPDRRTAPTTISVTIPKRSTHGGERKPAYISPNTASISVSISNTSQSAGPFIANCSGGRCVETVDAPLGDDLFTVSLYSQSNAAGSVLSSGSTSATIAAAANTVVSLTFDPVLASASVAQTLFRAGVSSIASVDIQAVDPSGATIVGPGSFESASGTPSSISLALSAPSGHVTLNGQTSFSSPAPAATNSGTTLTYDGAATNFVYPTLDLSIDGSQTFTANIPLVPNLVGSPVPIVEQGNTISSATLGPDGNVWYTAYGSSAEIARYNVTSATVTPFGLAVGSAEPGNIVAGGDGDLYFFEAGTTTFGQITTSGILREYPANFSVTSMVKGVDGNPWFVKSDSTIGKIDSTGTITSFGITAVPGTLTAGPNDRMWFFSSIDGIGRPGDSEAILSSVAADGSGETNTPPDDLGYSPEYGLVYAPDGNFYTYTSGNEVSFRPSGIYSPPSCSGGQYAATLSDGTIVFYGIPGGRDGSGSGYNAIRSNGSCVAVTTSQNSPSFAFLSGKIIGVSPGHGFYLTKSTIQAFDY